MLARTLPQETDQKMPSTYKFIFIYELSMLWLPLVQFQILKQFKYFNILSYQFLLQFYALCYETKVEPFLKPLETQVKHFVST